MKNKITVNIVSGAVNMMSDTAELEYVGEKTFESTQDFAKYLVVLDADNINSNDHKYMKLADLGIKKLQTSGFFRFDSVYYNYLFLKV